MKRSSNKKVFSEIAEEECVMIKKSVLFQLLNSGGKNHLFKRRFYIISFITVVLLQVMLMLYLNKKIDDIMEESISHVSFDVPEVHTEKQISPSAEH